jgi:hypothetical protein
MTLEMTYRSGQLTDLAPSRPIGMSGRKQKTWRRLATIAAILFVLASAKVMANPQVRRPVANFIYFYQQTENLGIWDRLMFSVLMTRTTEPSS